MREGEFIDWIRQRGGLDPAKVLLGPGDDMAELAFDHDRLLVAADPVLDGVHVQLAEAGPRLAGRKALARNLSDIAAMAALPVGAVATVALPKGFAEQDARELYAGMEELANAFQCPIVGGDVASWAGPLAISVTVFATPAGATGGIRPVRRDGGRAGNVLFVTGALGGAWRTERHLRFTPRVREAIVLALKYRLRAMIDISDGLAMDLGRLCRESGVGAEILADRVPIHPDAQQAGDDQAALRAALHDGEDYELLFAVPPAQASRLEADDRLGVQVTRIGTLTRKPGLQLIGADGQRQPLEPAGWEHRT